MALSRLIKATLGILLITSQEAALARQAKSVAPCMDEPLKPCGDFSLPSGCEAFDLEKGNPNTAKTFIFALQHKVCDEAKITCTDALLLKKFGTRKKAKKKTTFFFEHIGHDQASVCQDESNQLAELSEDCRGWNIPGEKLEEKLKLQGEMNALQQLYQDLKMLAEEDYRKNKNPNGALKKIIKTYIGEIGQNIETAKKLLDSHNKKYPNKYTYIERSLKGLQYQWQYAKGMLSKIKSGRPEHEVMNDLHNDLAQSNIKSKIALENTDALLRKPNNALVKTLQSQPEDKTSVVYVRAKHASKRHVKNPTPEENKVVDELWSELDKFADTNPYTVLSCRL